LGRYGGQLMAVFKNDPFPGTDYSKFLTWEKVVTPAGQVLYVVPGNPAYVYDPVASNATGRKVFRANPKQQIADEQKAKDDAESARKQQERANSPLGQVTPVGATVVGTLAANEIMKSGFGNAPAEAKDILADGTVFWSDGSIRNTAGEIISKPPAAAPTLSQAAAQGAVGNIPTTAGDLTAPSGTGSLGAPTQDFSLNGVQQPDGSVITDQLPPNTTVEADGSIIDAKTGAMIGRVVQGAMGAYQIYQGITNFKDDKIGGGLDIASGAANVGAALGSEAAGSFAGPLMAAKGGYDVIKGFNRGGEGVRSGTTTLGAGIGSMIMPGLGTAAGAAVGNVVGYGLQGSGIKNDLALAAVSPVLLGAKKLGIIDKLMHKTTRQVAQEHTQDLLNQGKDNQNWQQYAAGMREQFNAAPPDKSKPFAGKYATWADYEKGGLDAADLTGVYGNLKVYGPEWANLTQEQRQAITQANIESGLYKSKKGEVEITDEKKAIENKNNVLKGFEVGAKTAAPVIVNKAPAPANINAVGRAAAQGFTGRR